MPTRAACVRAFAKLNLSLKVPGKRPDGYHELRTIFQTISLADRITIRATPGGQTQLKLNGNVEIPNNLILRAAQAVLDAAQTTATIEFELEKCIPLGGGLGGGSTDAAAVLLALPPLLGIALPLSTLHRLAVELGADVPFFLLGGTALGLGRGTELYPLPELPPRAGLVVAPNVHVSTPAAFQALNRGLTDGGQFLTMDSFQSFAWSLGGLMSGEGWSSGENDFESVVFQQHPLLASIKTRLQEAGARPAMMTGSGASLFGLFASASQARAAASTFREEKVFPITLVSRKRYQQDWWRRLASHLEQKTWPPLSRYAQ